MSILSDKRVLKSRKHKAFTIIEALMALSVFLILITSFYRVFSAGSNLMAESKRKLLATGVANEKMEHVRGMEYSQIGVTSGSPSGILDPDEYVDSGGQRFHVRTYVQYVDNPGDGTATTGDSTPNDYKKVVIEVAWREELSSQRVSFISNFSPFGTETSIGGGTLMVSVNDSTGQPLSGATVNIYNNHVTPSINANYVTSGAGTVFLTGVAFSNLTYEITVSKSGYETVPTYPPYPQSSFYPNDIHFSVVSGTPSNPVLTSGKLLDFEMHFMTPGDYPINSSIDFSMVGGKELGINVDESIKFNYVNDSLSSDSSGVAQFNDMSPGTYQFAVDNANYVFWKNSSGMADDPDYVSINETDPIIPQNIYLLDKSVDSYFLKVEDINGDPIINAQVTLDATNPLDDFSETLPTDARGYVYFPILPDPLDPTKPMALVNGASYDVTVIADGYQSENKTITLNELTQDTIDLTLQ